MTTRTLNFLPLLKMDWQVLQLLTPHRQKEQHLMVEMVQSALQHLTVDLQRMARLAIDLWALQ